jgi:hypothetical protein
MLFLLSLLAWTAARGVGLAVADRTEDRPRAAAALGAASAGGVDLARTASPVLDGPRDLRVVERVAEADVHRCGLQADRAERERRRAATLPRFPRSLAGRGETMLGILLRLSGCAWIMCFLPCGPGSILSMSPSKTELVATIPGR